MQAGASKRGGCAPASRSARRRTPPAPRQPAPRWPTAFRRRRAPPPHPTGPAVSWHWDGAAFAGETAAAAAATFAGPARRRAARTRPSQTAAAPAASAGGARSRAAAAPGARRRHRPRAARPWCACARRRRSGSSTCTLAPPSAPARCRPRPAGPGKARAWARVVRSGTGREGARSPRRGRSGACPAEAPLSTGWAHCERVVRGRKHGDHQVERAVAAVEGGVTEEKRGEGRLARHQPPLAVAAQPLVVQRAADAVAAVAQRARGDDGVHGRLAARDGSCRGPAAAHRLAVAGDVHMQLGQRPLLVPHPAATLGPKEQRQLQLHLQLYHRPCRGLTHEHAGGVRGDQVVALGPREGRRLGCVWRRRWFALRAHLRRGAHLPLHP
eukprot:scaffold113640_cov48-Phaeocystis_antarctica.AAC.2